MNAMAKKFKKKNGALFALVLFWAFILPAQYNMVCAEATPKKQSLSKPVPQVDEGAYKNMRQEFVKLYRVGKYREAALLMEKSLKRFPEKIQAMAWNIALAYGKIKKYKRGISALKKALKKGYWYNIWAFDGPLWKDYRQVKGFGKVIKMNHDLKDKAQASAKPDLQVVLPRGYDQSGNKLYPLFIALHGGGENIAFFKNKWVSDTLSRDFIRAYVQSSQMASMTGFHWTDLAVAQKEIAGAYNGLVASYLVDTDLVIIGGFSSGGYAALAVAFNNAVPVNGFITLCPPIPEGINEALALAAKERNLRGTIISTQMDPRISQQRTFIGMCKNVGLQYQLTVTPDTGHWYPPNLAEKIDQAIAHIRYK